MSLVGSLNDGVLAKKYPRFIHDPRAKMLTKYISIGGYSPGVRAFGTLIKAVRLIICKIIRLHPENDPLPTNLRLRPYLNNCSLIQV